LGYDFKAGRKLFQGIPDKVYTIKKPVVGRGARWSKSKSWSKKASRLAERLQSLVACSKGLETFAKEHVLRCVYEKRELEDLRRWQIRPKRSFSLGRL